MNQAQPQLNLFRGQQEQSAGIDRVARHNASFIEIMRGVAKRISLERGSVRIDDLRQFASERGLVPIHPNAWGGVFRGPEWQMVGREKSSVVSNHAREVKVWKWVGRDGC
jgi:hypothetical protein